MNEAVGFPKCTVQRCCTGAHKLSNGGILDGPGLNNSISEWGKTDGDVGIQVGLRENYRKCL